MLALWFVTALQASSQQQVEPTYVTGWSGAERGERPPVWSAKENRWVAPDEEDKAPVAEPVEVDAVEAETPDIVSAPAPVVIQLPPRPALSLEVFEETLKALLRERLAQEAAIIAGLAAAEEAQNEEDAAIALLLLVA